MLIIQRVVHYNDSTLDYASGGSMAGKKKCRTSLPLWWELGLECHHWLALGLTVGLKPQKKEKKKNRGDQ